jgi:ketosteroid isomerase-like protein
MEGDPVSVIRRLMDATNRHDLDALVDCVAENYRSEQPVHPARGFTGREQVRKNWSAILSDIPDFRQEWVQHAVAGNSVWVEIHGHGTNAQDQSPVDLAGVAIFTVENDRIVSARIYTESVEAAGGDIDSMIRDVYRAGGKES